MKKKILLWKAGAVPSTDAVSQDTLCGEPAVC